MHSSIYIFTCISGTITSYPHDYTHEIFKYAIGKSKNSAQIVLVRRDNLLHYCYVRSIREKQYFGICFRTDNIYNRIADLFGEFDHIYTEIVSAGILLQMDTNGQVIIGTTEFAKESVEITERSDRFINSLRLSAQTTQPLPPADFSISIKDCIELSLEQSTNAEITDAIKKYNNVYLVKSQAEISRLTEVTNIIKGKNDEIKTLTNELATLKDEIITLQHQKKQIKWVVLLLILIILGGISFFVYAYSNSQIIKGQTDAIDDLKDDVKGKVERIQFLKQNVINAEKELDKTKDQLRVSQDKLGSINDILNNDVSEYLFFSSWKSTNHTDNSTSEIRLEFQAYEGDVLTLPYKVSSEANCDFLTISYSKIGGALSQLIKTSGFQSGECVQKFNSNGVYQVIISYTKDYSQSKNEDCAEVKNGYIYRPLINRLRTLSEIDK